MKDYYKILGVDEEASDEEIRGRWIELTKHYHPDLRKTEEGDEKIKDIIEAYEVLRDEPSRFQYDFERDLKRSLIKKAAHHRQERETSIRKIIMISSGMLVLFLIVGFIVLRAGRIAPPPAPTAETVVLNETDKGTKQRAAPGTPPGQIDSKPQGTERALTEIKEVAVRPESKKEVVPPESTKMASLRPPQRSSGVESEKEKEPVPIILPEAKVSAAGQKEPPARNESEAERDLAPQAVVKPERPAAKEVFGEVPKETPKPVAREIPKEVLKEAPKQAVGETPKDVPREASNEAAKEVMREIPRDVPKEVPREVPKEAPKEIPKQIVKEIPKEVPKETPKQVTSEVSKEVQREIPKEVPPREVPKETLKEVSLEAPKETPGRVPGEIPRDVPKEVPREVLKEAPKEIPKQIVKVIPKEMPKETPRQVTKEAVIEVPREAATVTLHPGEHLTMWTKGGRVISSGPSPLAREEEVKRFFSNYVDRYNRRDVGGFLSLFSSGAIQNQTDRSEAIRNFYTKFFNQSQDLRYQLEGMKIDISPSRVVVKARFRVDQKLKDRGEEKVWKGRAHWDLVKEGGRLKIRSLDYQNEKSP